MSTTLSPVTPLTQMRVDTTCLSPAFVRVAVTGEIDLATAEMLHDELRTALSAQHPHRVEIDLAGVSFMDCTGLTVLIVARQAAQRTGCQLRITNPQPIVRRVLELTGLLDVLTATFGRAPLMPARSVSPAQVEPTPAAVTRPADLLVVA